MPILAFPRRRGEAALSQCRKDFPASASCSAFTYPPYLALMAFTEEAKQAGVTDQFWINCIRLFSTKT